MLGREIRPQVYSDKLKPTRETRCKPEVDLTAPRLQLCQQELASPGPKVIKLFFELNSAEHEIFSADKSENAN